MSKQFYFKQFSLAYICSLNVKTAPSQLIQFSLSTQFSSVWPIDWTLIKCYHSRPEWTWEQWQWRGTQLSTKLQLYWNLTIRLFSVISRTLVEGVLPLCREAVSVFYSPSWLGKILYVYICTKISTHTHVHTYIHSYIYTYIYSFINYFSFSYWIWWSPVKNYFRVFDF